MCVVYTWTCKISAHCVSVEWMEHFNFKALCTFIYIERHQQERRRCRCREIGLLSVTNILLGDRGTVHTKEAILMGD